MSNSMITYRYRIKDSTSGKHLQRMAWSCNRVWNYCNEMSRLAWRREKRVLSGFDLINLTAGSGHDLGLHADTIGEICKTYASKRKQFKKIRLRWRSKEHSLGWVPFKGRSFKLGIGSLRLKGRQFRFWQSRPVAGTVKAGSFAQDARGHWYVNFQCEVHAPEPGTGTAEIGIDLGLRDHVSCSDGVKYSRENLTRKYGDSLAMVQRANKKKRTTAIHAKIAHCREDWAHKVSTTIIQRASLIAVGDVSPSRLAKTRLAKSVYDAGWSQLRTMLAYKAMRLGISYSEVDESGSTVTCSACLARTGPSGLSNLGVRVWCCSACGVLHDRDTNAAHTILRRGRATLAGIL